MPERTCSIDCCNKPHFGRGWCKSHYLRWRRHGDPLGGGKPRELPQRLCSVEGCDRSHAARGWCKTHYERWKTTGTTERSTPGVRNEYRPLDLLTGELLITSSDGTEHLSTYDLVDHERISGHRWRVNAGGYLITGVGGRKTHRTVFLHRMLLGLDYGDQRIGDHANGNRRDNRRTNLRIVDATTNALNQAVINERGTSKYRGVCWDTRAGKWKAGVQADGRGFDLGYYASEEEAVDAVVDLRARIGIELGYPRRHPGTPSKSRR